MNCAQKNADATIKIKDFLKILSPERRVYRKIKMVREKGGMEKGVLGDHRGSMPKGAVNEMPVEEYLKMEHQQFMDKGVGSHWTKKEIEWSDDNEQVKLKSLADVKYIAGTKSETWREKYNKSGVLLENSFSICPRFCSGVDEVSGESWKLLIVDDDEPCLTPESLLKREASQKVFRDDLRCPYTKTSKGFHYYLRVAGCPWTVKSEEKVFCNFIGDMFGCKLNGNNIWEQVDRDVHNFNVATGKIPLIPFSQLAPQMGITWFDGIRDDQVTDETEAGRVEAVEANRHCDKGPKKTKKKKAPGLSKIASGASDMSESDKGGKKEHFKKEKAKQIASVKVKADTNFYKPSFKELKELLKVADPDMERNNWLEVGFALKGFGEDYLSSFIKWSSFKYVDDTYFDFLDDADLNPHGFTKEQWHATPRKEGGSGFEGADDVKANWNDGTWNKDTSRIIRWTGLKKRIKAWSGEGLEKGETSAYDLYYEEQWEQVLTEQLVLLDAQMIRVVAAFLDVTINTSLDSDFISEDSEKTKSFYMFDRLTGFWRMFHSGQSIVCQYLFDGMVPKVEDKIRKMIRAYPLLSATGKEADEWRAKNQSVVKKFSRLNLLLKIISAQAQSTNVAQTIHARCLNDTRFQAMDSNDESKGGQIKYLFPFSDAVLNLLTGEVRLPKRTDMLCINTGYKFPDYLTDKDHEPNAECRAIWAKQDEFLATLLCTRVPPKPTDKPPKMELLRDGTELPEEVIFMYRELARSMLGFNAFHHVIWMTGTGGNGKTLFMSFICKVFAKCSGTLNNSYWTSHTKGDTADSSLALVIPCRIALSAELRVDEKTCFSEERVKSLSGADVMVYRKLYENSRSDVAACSAWVAMNKVPKFDGEDGGMQRRIWNIAFCWAFGSRNKGKTNYSKGVSYNVETALNSELWRDAFILRLRHVMLMDIVVDGLIPNDLPYPIPKSVEENTQDLFTAQQGHVLKFIAWAFDDVRENPQFATVRVASSQVTRLYNQYCSKSSDDASQLFIEKADKMSPTYLHQSMQSAGFEKDSKGFIGIVETAEKADRNLSAPEAEPEYESGSQSEDE